NAGDRSSPRRPRHFFSDGPSLAVVLAAVAIFVDVVAADLDSGRVDGGVLVVAVVAPDDAVVVGVGAGAGADAGQPGRHQLLPLPQVTVDARDRQLVVRGRKRLVLVVAGAGAYLVVPAQKAALQHVDVVASEGALA